MVPDTTRAMLRALEAAKERHPDLRAYYAFHGAVFEVLGEAKHQIGETAQIADKQLYQARLLQGQPALRFEELPLEAARFTQLVRTLAELLMRYDPELANQTIPESQAACLTLARQRFEEGQAGVNQSEITLAQASVDLALKPILQWAAERVLPRVNQTFWKRGRCPVCGGAPDFATLDEETGARHLLCSRCDSLWVYRRVGCPFCGTVDHSRLFYYPGEDKAYRLYVCDACGRYLKTIDLREVAREVMFPVERITTVAMDAAARQEGYR